MITPIFKSGDKTSVSNYRPISLLCCISKVLERLIYDKTIDFVVKSISSDQYGFLPKRSAPQQLLIMLAQIHKAFDNNAVVDCIYLDFKKAFDRVPHGELLVKLRKIGISGTLWKWFKSYLASRVHCVSISDCVSSTLPVISGVPQGNILGPMLFLIYINDLTLSTVYSHLLLFADDTKCFMEIGSVEDVEKLQSDLNEANVWSRLWNLLFNESKTVHLCYSKQGLTDTHNYTLNGSEVIQKETHRDLGIIMCADLSWNSHCVSLCQKSYKILGLLRRSFSNHSVKVRKQLYLTLVRSKITYCSPIWRPNLIKDIDMLEKIQRRATKYILSDYVSDYKINVV